nr:LCP family protein [uncultured Marvinbryantia sp.]
MARDKEKREKRRTKGGSSQQQQQYYQQDPYGQQQYYQQNPNGQQYYQQDPNGQQQYYQQDPNGQQQYYQQDPYGQQQYYQQDPYGQQQYYQQNRYGQPGMDPRQNYDQGEKEAAAAKKKKKRRKRKVILFVVEVLLLVVLAAALYVGAKVSKISKMQAQTPVNNEKQSEMVQQIQAQLDDEVEERLKGYWNIALYGTDNRDKNTNGQSDAIMVASINLDTNDVKLVSVYRDTYLDDTTGSYGKATDIYAAGGPARSINMLNKNLDLDITDYVTVNMNVLADVVDAIGGIDIEITEDEATWIDNYQDETSTITNREIIPISGSSGMVHLNGLQATAYCRIRAIGNDYERTERQRKVLSLILDSVKSNPTVLIGLVDDLIDAVDTNLTMAEIMNFATNIASYNLVETKGFPFEQTSMEINYSIVVPINLAQNVSELHEYLFGVQGYTPSSTVQEISDYIANYTGVYE